MLTVSKIHLGCGSKVLPGFLNIDKFVTGQTDVVQSDLEGLLLASGSVDMILAEHVVEHMSFQEEREFFQEAFRVLKPGGAGLEIEVPDLVWLCQEFLAGKTGFPSFYEVGSLDHYFGNGKSGGKRWGLITTHFFGNQNGEGQFHKTGFSVDKLESISEIVGFQECEVKKVMNKGAQCLRAVFRK